jgi:hypothetical protein
MNVPSENFMNLIDKLDDRSYLLSIIAYSVAPTLGKVKPSYLIIFHNKGKKRLYDLWLKHKHNIKKGLNIKFYELKKLEESEAVLFYNEDQLESLMREESNISFLQKYGYSRDMSIDECLQHLKERYVELCPHEMGVFLGYPIEDVVEFIEFPHKKALMFGYWKVYYNLEKAINTFNKYDEMKSKVIKLIGKGIQLDTIINSISFK